MIKFNLVNCDNKTEQSFAYLKLVFLFLSTLVLFSSFSAAASDPGHSASSVDAGTFGAGNFVFQNNLTVGGSTLSVNNGTGRVGIGTATPNSILNIQGGVGSGSIINITNASGAFVFSIDAQGNTLWNGRMPTINFNNAYTIGFNDIDIGDPGIGEGFGWTGTQAGWIIDVAPQARSTNPNSDGNLNLYGSSTGNWNISLWRPMMLTYNDTVYNIFQTDSAGRVGILGGNVGIGTSTPGQKLTVVGTANVTGLSYFGANASMGGYQIRDLGTPKLSTDAATKAYVDSITGGGSATWSLTSGVVHLNDTTDKVSIGGTSSAYKLDVVGNVSLNNSLFVTNAGNVGIGTSTPSTKLEVVGSGGIKTSDGSVYHFTKRIAAPYQDYAYHYLKLFKMPLNASNEPAITVSGRVSTYRSNDLAVSGSAEIYASRGWNQNVRYSVWKQAGGNDFSIVNLTEGGEEWIALVYDAHAGASISEWDVDLQVYSTNNSFLALTSHANSTTIYHSNSIASLVGQENYFLGGNIGMGTTTPTQKLDVRGNINVSGDVYVNNATSLATWAYNQTTGAITYIDNKISANNASWTSTYNATYAALSSSSGTNTHLHNAANITAGTFGSGNFVFQNNLTVGGSTLFVNNGTGRVGIGTTTPVQTLTVVGTANVTGLSYFGANASMSGYQIRDLGTPKLSTDAATKAYVDSITGGGSATWSLTSGVVHLNDTTDKVSIGGTSSAYKLDVVGNVSLNNSLFVTNTGNVGIGTSAPTDILTVQGDAGGTINQTLLRLAMDASWSVGSYRAIDWAQTTGNPLARIAVEPDASGDWNMDFYTTSDGGSSINRQMRLTDSGELGIGTNSPGQKLTVVGTANVTGLSYFGANASMSGYQIRDLGTPKLSTDAATKAYVDSVTGGGSATWTHTGSYTILNNSGDYVGIGTATPGSKLEVLGQNITLFSGSTSQNVSFNIFDNSGSTAGFRIRYEDYTGATYLESLYDNAAGDIAIRTKVAGTPVSAIFIESAGNVGIGTTSPTQKLDVNGNANISGTVYTKSSGSAGSSQTAIYGQAQFEQNVAADSNGTGWRRVAHISPQSGAGRGENEVTLYTMGGSYTPVSTRIRWWHDWGTSAGVTIASESGAAAQGYWNETRVTDNSTDSYLEVYFVKPMNSTFYLTMQYDGGMNRGELYSGALPNGGDNVRATAKLGTFNIGNNAFFVDTNKNVGINLTSPTHTLNVQGTFNTTGLSYFGANASMGGYQINNLGTPKLSTDAATKAYVDSITGGGSATWSLTSGVVHLNDTTDKVSIGGTTSGYKLDVVGNVSLNNSLFVTSAGNVGVGTASPNYKLEINAANKAMNVSNNLFVNATNVGIGANNPGTELHLQGSSPELRLTSDQVGLNTTIGLYEAATATDGFRIRYEGTGNKLQIFARDTSTDYVTRGITIERATGEVGIGTTAPAYKLDVVGNVSLNNSLFVTNAGNVGIGTSSPSENLHVVGSFRRGNTRFFNISRDLNGSTVGNYVNIGNFSNTWGRYAKFKLYGTITNTVQMVEFEFYGTSYPASNEWITLPLKAGMQFGGAHNFVVEVRQTSSTGPIEARIRLTQTNGGYALPLTIDIETNSDFAADATAGSGATAAAGYMAQPGFQFPVSGSRFSPSTQGLFILSSGNVGIGTVSPTQKLDINGSVNISSSTGVLYTPQICLNGVCQTSWGGVTAGTGQWDNSSSQVFIRSGYPATLNVSNNLFVNSTNMGVGMSNPAHKLSVAGSLNITATSNAASLRVEDTGDVIIGI